MTDSGTEKPALMRWLIVGPFGDFLDGKLMTLGDGSSLADRLKSGALEFSVEVPDKFRGQGTTTITFPLQKLSGFSVSSVVAKVPLLRELTTLTSKIQTNSDTIDQISKKVEPGVVADEIDRLTNNDPKPDSSSGNGDGVDKIFDQVGAQDADEARSAIDSFVRASRKNEKKGGVARPIARKVRDLIEAAVYQTAQSILRTAEVSTAESLLRGLSFFLGNCPNTSGIQVQIASCSAKNIGSKIESCVPDDLEEAFDAIFVPTALENIDQIVELAELGESLLCPIIAEVPRDVVRLDDLKASLDALEQNSSAVAEAWKTARDNESTRWITAVENAVVLKVEGGVAKRLVLGSGVWALAAQFAKSYRLSGGFAHILGRTGSIQAPAMSISGDVSIPTLALISLENQRRLAGLGITAIGSGRNDDQVILTRTPVVRASDDAPPLGSQIVTGRVVRFSRWVVGQVPNDATDDMVNEIFNEAARVFLFPSIGHGSKISARRAEGSSIAIEATTDPNATGHALELGFELSTG